MEVKIIRSNRKTVSIQVNQDLSITVRAPQRVTQKEIKRILEKMILGYRSILKCLGRNRLRQKT